MTYGRIFESEYGGSARNFHVAKRDDELHVELTYPPYTDADNANDQCRYVVFDQESVRASDGIRIHFDFDRNGYVVQQPRFGMKKLSEGVYDSTIEWIDVGFFEAWHFGDPNDDEEATRVADADYEAAQIK